jgi:DNA repair and recombination protein RAD54B
MGSAAWKGERLYAGYCFRIDDKEVELDSRVDSSQLPSSVETSRPRDIEDGVSQLTSPKSHPLGRVGVEQATTPTMSSMKFVAPGSFYGVGRSKPRGPL